MKKFYAEPELEIREYVFDNGSVLTTSQPEDKDNSLVDDDEYDIFG